MKNIVLTLKIILCTTLFQIFYVNKEIWINFIIKRSHIDINEIKLNLWIYVIILIICFCWRYLFSLQEPFNFKIRRS